MVSRRTSWVAALAAATVTARTWQTQSHRSSHRLSFPPLPPAGGRRGGEARGEAGEEGGREGQEGGGARGRGRQRGRAGGGGGSGQAHARGAGQGGGQGGGARALRGGAEARRGQDRGHAPRGRQDQEQGHDGLRTHEEPPDGQGGEEGACERLGREEGRECATSGAPRGTHVESAKDSGALELPAELSRNRGCVRRVRRNESARHMRVRRAFAMCASFVRMPHARAIRARVGLSRRVLAPRQARAEGEIRALGWARDLFAKGA